MANNFKIRNYIKAKSENRLRRLMFEKQIKLGMAALEFDITYAKGSWFAWYYEVLTNDKMGIISNESTENDRG
jgi:hypothetical protein